MAFENLRSNARAQILLGLLSGIVFGFLLQKGGVTEYEVILGQLLLTDFTVVKIMLSAIIVGMIGVFLMKWAGIASLHTRAGSIGATVIGGLIFGAGFAVLGYCPGTAAGAFGSGALDAAIGMIGIAIGAGIFARLYPSLDRSILNRGPFPAETIPELIGMRQGSVVIVVAVLIACLLYFFEVLGI
ncbi:MAG TPA: YeeE/YedE thiosulfate transporter family protein [Methanoregulaceae archaeon]|nr:YeeE/YedE thiosulfate transporter family protein [Methanoregulaceae archaeon]